MTVNQKVQQFRKIIDQKNLSAYIISSKDSHDSEYTSPYWQELEYITGFTGGEGTAVITQDEAFIWVDSRYFIQCKNEIEGTCFKMKKTDGPEAEPMIDYLKTKFNNNEKIGINAQTLMVGEYRKLKSESLNISLCNDLIDEIWTDRPVLPQTEVRIQKHETTCQNSDDKISEIRKEMKKDGADYTLIASLDDIAWILDLRASDIEYVPVFYAYLLIGKEETILFTEKSRFRAMETSGLNFKIKKYDEIFNELEKLTGTIVINPNRINMSLYLKLKVMKVIEKIEYSTDMKMIKNQSELVGILKAQRNDTVAIIKLMYFIKSHKGNGLSEKVISDFAEKTKKAVSDEYEGPSFSTISAFGENGAIVHYHTDDKHDKPIKGNGLLVFDCGSQYENGTTDFTRTFLFGRATKEQIKYYTAVLKAHLKLQMVVFPKGTTAVQLDTLARAEIWKVFQEYYHGTGHGVGCHLSVHEGPLRISSKGSNTVLKESMILTDEPGIYIENKFGIRIENMVYVDRTDDSEDCRFYRLYPLTRIPYERKLIDKNALTKEEIDFINNYHEKIYSTYKDYFTKEEAVFLREITKAL